MEIKVNFTGILFVALLVLKLTILPTMPWWCVVVPLIPLALSLATIILVFVIGIISILIATVWDWISWKF